MKGGVSKHVRSNMIYSSKTSKATRMRGNGKPGQKFNPDRFAGLCIKMKKDPAEAALKLLTNPVDLDQLKAKEKLDAYIRLMEYLYPKQRAIEHSGSIGIGLSELLEQAESEWRKRG